MSEPHQNHQDFRKTRQIVLTPEDKAIIKECRDESFYYRCLPLSIALGVGARYLQYAGILKGKYLGIIGALATGFIAGKVSYIPECRKKFLERAPNTEYGRLFTSGSGSIEGYIPENPAQKPYEPLVNNTELDDSKRPTLDREVPFKHDYEIEEETLNNSQKNLSYDELRRKNREQYQQNRSALETSDRRQYSRPDDRPPSKLRDIDYGTKIQGKKNKYGDLMESED